MKPYDPAILEDIRERLSELKVEIERIERIFDPASLEDPKTWNIGGMLHIVKRLANETHSEYWNQVKGTKTPPKYWERIAMKKRNQAIAESREDRLGWDKGADR